jgi:hypothetical protein
MPEILPSRITTLAIQRSKFAAGNAAPALQPRRRLPMNLQIGAAGQSLSRDGRGGTRISSGGFQLIVSSHRGAGITPRRCPIPPILKNFAWIVHD